MSVIVLEKKYQDTVIELNKVKEQKNEMAADLVEAQSEIAQLKKWLTYSKMTSAQLRDEFATQET
jgi:predicted  nucleic acid-binding Zn-ribbon protein